VLTADGSISFSGNNVITEDNILVPNNMGVMKTVIINPSKQNMNTNSTSKKNQRRDIFEEGQSSQGAMTGSSEVFNPNTQGGGQIYVEKRIVRTELGDQKGEMKLQRIKNLTVSRKIQIMWHVQMEDDETLHLRKFAKQYKKRLRDSQRFVESEASGLVPIGLMANVEEVIE
jgi:hypothetical protein